MLLRRLENRLGDIPADARSRIMAAPESDLHARGLNVLVARNLDVVFRFVN